MDWEKHKQAILEIYLTQDKSLSKLMPLMKRYHGFDATKAQYESQFKRWQVRKNLTGQEWEYVCSRVTKRKADGKDSDVYFNEQLIPSKKVKKEISRRFPPTFQKRNLRDSSPDQPGAVSIATPKASTAVVSSPSGYHPILLHKLPWFQFQQVLESTAIASTINIHGAELTKRSQEFLRDSLTLSKIDNTGGLISHLQALVEPIFPERRDGELSLTMQRLFDVTNRNVFFPVFQLTIFFVSNNFWGRLEIESFLQHIVEFKHEGLLALCLKIDVPTIQTFAERILDHAVTCEFTHIVQFLLDLEIGNRMVSGIHGGRLLQKAASWKKWEIVQVLVERGAALNIPVCQEYPFTPLHRAVLAGNVEMARNLIDAGAKIDIPSYGWSHCRVDTPLSLAILQQHRELAGILVDAGANIDSCEVQGVPALRWSELYNDDEFHSMLCTASMNEQFPITTGSIVKIASLGSLALSDYLNGNGYDILPKAKTRLEDALQLAVERLDIDAVESLLDIGVDPNAEGSGCLPLPLMSAVRRGDFDLAKRLLNAGADATTPGVIEKITECIDNNTDFLRLLVQHDADIDEVLQCAAFYGNIECVKELVRAGADVNAAPATANGKTALQAAVSQLYPNIELVEILLKAGADVNAAPDRKGGRTALQGAVSVQKPDMELIEMLLEAEADIHAAAAPIQGITALQGAAISGHIKIVLRFLEAGADVNAPAAMVDGRTAIDGAAEHGRLDMVQLLLNAGAESYSSDGRKFGRAIELAEGEGHLTIARLLESA